MKCNNTNYLTSQKRQRKQQIPGEETHDMDFKLALLTGTKNKRPEGGHTTATQQQQGMACKTDQKN